MVDRPQTYTITAITRMIKRSIEDQFTSIWVEGEISNYHHHGSGHRYITLKDSGAVLKVVIWRTAGANLKFEPKDGQQVLAFGDITLYEKGGQYQLNCRKMIPAGVGQLELAFRQLQEKLSKEGLFAPELKKELPQYPEKIGIVTSPTGAAIRDIIQIAKRRNPAVQLIIYPAAVQGEGSEIPIARGIEYFNSRDDIDIIVTGRGGGSLEDLWSFNTEIVVRAIAGSKIPVVSGVGHEIDTTLSDYAADLRAPTPSAASELTVWSQNEFREKIQAEIQAQCLELDSMVTDARENLVSILDRPIYKRPYEMVNQYRQHLDFTTRLFATAGKNNFERIKNSLSLGLSRLETLSPLKTLARGYSVTRRVDNQRLVCSMKDIKVGDQVESILQKDRLISTVNEVHKG